jgi:hypothetical protein
LRYDLRGAVKPLPAPFGDANGTTARNKVIGQTGQFFPGEAFDIRLDSTSYVDGAPDDAAMAGKRFFVATVTLRNAAPTEQDFHWVVLNPVLTASDGTKIVWNKTLSKATEKDARTSLQPGKEFTGRMYFELPINLRPRTLAISEMRSRTYNFDVSHTRVVY